MKNIKIIIVSVLVLTVSACNPYEMFEREQYKHVISLLSSGAFNVFAQEHDLAGADANGFTNGSIAASVGGTGLTKQAISLAIIEDEELLRVYNNTNYSLESFRYAKWLSADRYIVDQLSINIPAGERSGIMNIRVRAGGLSPDSVYYIPFNAVSTSAYELNQNKNTVLYRVHISNFWSSTVSVPQYSHRGLRTQVVDLPEGATPPATVTTVAQKHVHPVSANSVRTFAGNRSFEPNHSLITQWGILLTIDADNKVNITPWDPAYGIEIYPVNDPDDDIYTNTFELFDDGFGRLFRIFWLNYNYVDPVSSVTFNMKEELRIQHVIEIKN